MIDHDVSWNYNIVDANTIFPCWQNHCASRIFGLVFSCYLQFESIAYKGACAVCTGTKHKTHSIGTVCKCVVCCCKLHIYVHTHAHTYIHCMHIHLNEIWKLNWFCNFNNIEYKAVWDCEQCCHSHNTMAVLTCNNSEKQSIGILSQTHTCLRFLCRWSIFQNREHNHMSMCVCGCISVRTLW